MMSTAQSETAKAVRLIYIYMFWRRLAEKFTKYLEILSKIVYDLK